MRKKAIQAMFLVVTLTAAMLASPNTGDEAQAKAKKKYSREECRWDIQSGKDYRISKIIADATKNGWSKKACQKIKWKSNSSRLQIKGKKFIAKKSGEYTITGVYKKTKYVLRLYALDAAWKTVPDDIAYIKIQHMAELKRIDDEATVRELCSRLNQAQYKLNTKSLNKRRAGWTYRVFLCRADGSVERDFTIYVNSVTESSIWYQCQNDGNLYYDMENLYNRISTVENL